MYSTLSTESQGEDTVGRAQKSRTKEEPDAALYARAASNKALHLTAYSLCSYLAPASGSR